MTTEIISLTKTYRTPVYLAQQNGNQISYHLAGYQDTLVTFNPDPDGDGTILNEFGSNYTSLYYDLIPGNPRSLLDI
jgi:hypothetical protein